MRTSIEIFQYISIVTDMLLMKTCPSILIFLTDLSKFIISNNKVLMKSQSKKGIRFILLNCWNFNTSISYKSWTNCLNFSDKGKSGQGTINDLKNKLHYNTTTKKSKNTDVLKLASEVEFYVYISQPSSSQIIKNRLQIGNINLIFLCLSRFAEKFMVLELLAVKVPKTELLWV